MARKSGREMAEQLSEFANVMMGFERTEFVDTVITDHRYLQDEMFGMFFACIQEWALSYENGNYDFRNERACKASYEMIQSLKEKKLF